MAIAFVRDTQAVSAGVTNINVTVPSVGQGHLVVVSIKTTAAVTSLSLTDNASTPNTYLSAVAVASGTNNMYLWYGVAVTGGTTSIMVSWATSTSVRVTVDEYAGAMQTNAAVFDVASSGSGSGATSSSVSLVPTSSGELIVSALSTSSASSIIAGSGFTLANSSASNATEYKASGTTLESVGYSWTTNSAYAQVAAAFKPTLVTDTGFLSMF